MDIWLSHPTMAAADNPGFDGIGWMSNRDNSPRACLLFGVRFQECDAEKRLDFSFGDGFAGLARSPAR